MIKDRRSKKWTAIMLPEHVAAVKLEIENDKKGTQPILDEDKIQEIEMTILEGMEYASILKYIIFREGYFHSIIGRAVQILYLKQEIWIEDGKGDTHKLPFSKIIDVVHP